MSSPILELVIRHALMDFEFVYYTREEIYLQFRAVPVLEDTDEVCERVLDLLNLHFRRYGIQLTDVTSGHTVNQVSVANELSLKEVRGLGLPVHYEG